MKTNHERANYGPKDHQDTRIEHQVRQVKRREARKAAKK